MQPFVPLFADPLNFNLMLHKNNRELEANIFRFLILTKIYQHTNFETNGRGSAVQIVQVGMEWL